MSGNYSKEEMRNEAIDRGLRWVAKFGTCPVCRERPSGHGVTCGDLLCTARWVNPGLHRKSDRQLLIDMLGEEDGAAEYERRKRHAESKEEREREEAERERKQARNRAKRRRRPRRERGESSPEPAGRRDSGTRRPRPEPGTFKQAQIAAYSAIDDRPWEEAREVIRTFFETWNTIAPKNDNALKRIVHVHRLKNDGFTAEQKEASRAWIEANPL